MRTTETVKYLRILLAASSITAGLLSAPVAHATTACSIAARGSSLVTLGGQAVALPATPPDCEGVVVARGEVVVCVQDRRGRLQCRQFAAGSTLSAKLLGPVDASRGWLDVLGELLAGEPRSTGAQNRGDTETALPSGVVAFASGDIMVDPASRWFGEVERIDIIDAESGATVATLRSSGSSVISRRMLVPGRSYAWTIRSRSAALDETSGRFRVATAEELGVVDREASRIAANELAGPAGRALMLAAWLHKRGLRFDAQQVLRRAGLGEQ